MTRLQPAVCILCLALAGATSLAEIPGQEHWPIPELTQPKGQLDPWSPATYPDERGFEARATTITETMAAETLGRWRRGWFGRGGDPAKYMFGPTMAKLMLDPKAKDALQIVNDDRTYKEHYHFAAVNWARFLPIFRKALTEETYKGVSQKAAGYTAYHSGSGTENHKVMWYTSALVMPHYIESDTLGRMGKQAVLGKMKKWLRSYVKKLYAAGQGEWDSSTYLAFDINGMLNVYDFSTDPECRLLARAALDWYLTGYALKYTDGVFCGPNQRGFAKGPFDKFTDHQGVVWWGGFEPTKDNATNARHAFHAITSAYRPNKVICDIARRDLPDLPYEAHNTKPSYWAATGDPRPAVYAETVFVSPHYTMGSLANGHGGQITRFMLVARGKAGPVVLTGGHPRQSDHTGKKTGIGFFTDGKGRYDCSAQVGRTYVSLTTAPEDAQVKFSHFTIPDGVTPQIDSAGWAFMEVGDTYLALRSLGDRVEIGQALLTDKQRKANAKAAADNQPPKYTPDKILTFPGTKTGFILETGDKASHGSFGAFRKAALAGAKVDLSDWRAHQRVVYTAPEGTKLTVEPVGKDNRAKITVNGKAYQPQREAVYRSPYIRQADGVLTVNNGKEGFVVDFTGDLPVYKKWVPGK